MTDAPRQKLRVIERLFIRRADLRADTRSLYVFGDNAARKGLGGQAREMRGEPNAHGIATKWGPGLRAADFFSDAQFQRVVKIINADIVALRRRLPEYDCLVFPAAGIGSGLAQLQRRAPAVWQYLQRELMYLYNLGR